MSIFKRKNRSQVFLTTTEGYDMLCCSGYTSLAHNPEVVSAVKRVAELISSMTIYLMSNTEKGDKRIKNELSRKVDIQPCKGMTRRTWMESIVTNMLLHGRGNAVVLPITNQGYLEDLIPMPAHSVQISGNDLNYSIRINGVEVDPSDVLHFVYNPSQECPWKGAGIHVVAKDIANNLKQAQETRKGFLESKWNPPLIIAVDGIIDNFASKDGRKKMLEEYIETSEKGQPWVVPADQMKIESHKPLTLNDLAINDGVEIDKKTIAAIIGVPASLLGVGEFNKEEWNSFINTTVRVIAQEIEQELTQKLLISEKWYFKFNVSSLLAYDITELGKLYGDFHTKGIVTKNEVRAQINKDPVDDGDEFVILENYIPASKIGEQLKLLQNGEE